MTDNTIDPETFEEHHRLIVRLAYLAGRHGIAAADIPVVFRDFPATCAFVNACTREQRLSLGRPDDVLLYVAAEQLRRDFSDLGERLPETPLL
jgi:hypothetical protein